MKLIKDNITPSEEERGMLAHDIQMYTLTAFQELNKELNRKGLMLTISVLGEELK